RAVNREVEDALAGPRDRVLGEIEADSIGVASLQSGDVVAEIAVAPGLVDGLRRGVGDLAGVDSLRGAVGGAAAEISIGREAAGRGAARVDRDGARGRVDGQRGDVAGGAAGAVGDEHPVAARIAAGDGANTVRGRRGADDVGPGTANLLLPLVA